MKAISAFLIAQILLSSTFSVAQAQYQPLPVNPIYEAAYGCFKDTEQFHSYGRPWDKEKDPGKNPEKTPELVRMQFEPTLYGPSKEREEVLREQALANNEEVPRFWHGSSWSLHKGFMPAVVRVPDGKNFDRVRVFAKRIISEHRVDRRLSAPIIGYSQVPNQVEPALIAYRTRVGAAPPDSLSVSGYSQPKVSASQLREISASTPPAAAEGVFLAEQLQPLVAKFREDLEASEKIYQEVYQVLKEVEPARAAWKKKIEQFIAAEGYGSGKFDPPPGLLTEDRNAQYDVYQGHLMKAMERAGGDPIWKDPRYEKMVKILSELQAVGLLSASLLYFTEEKRHSRTLTIPRLDAMPKRLDPNKLVYSLQSCLNRISNKPDLMNLNTIVLGELGEIHGYLSNAPATATTLKSPPSTGPRQVPQDLPKKPASKLE